MLKGIEYDLIEALQNWYENDENEYIDMLFYLYHSTTSVGLKSYIKRYFDDKGFCVHCGNELQYKDWIEPHGERYGEYYCNCGEWEE